MTSFVIGNLANKIVRRILQDARTVVERSDGKGHTQTPTVAVGPGRAIGNG